jgi:hypothetical protein
MGLCGPSSIVNRYPAPVSGCLRRCGKRFLPAGVLCRPRPGDETLSARVEDVATQPACPHPRPAAAFQAQPVARFDSRLRRRTRRRYSERPDCWHIYYVDVHVGTIAVMHACRPMELEFGVLSGNRVTPGKRRHRGNFRPGPHRLRYGMAGPAADPDRSRFRPLARGSRPDRAEICDVGSAAKSFRRRSRPR